ncbi:MAG: MscS Mechanosensitive ion channel [Rhodospirillales bacterium]|nr:MscS Mechanosensitive ion channel [Rhodospirillales bacterium]
MDDTSFRQTIDRVLAAASAWLPPPVWSAGILLCAVLVALLLHRLSLRAFNRFLTTDKPRTFLRTFVGATAGPSRLAFVVFALGLALPSTSFATETTDRISHVLLVAFTVLVGWSAIRAFEIAATLYLQRFRTDVDDNLLARKHVTQIRILKRAVDTLVVIITLGAALMSFDSVRQYGVSLFASAGAASLVVGLAARPLLTNLIAGLQIAITQPIRLEDAVIVEGEWGWVEEITSTYVVIRLWDWRRLIVPLAYFLDKPFQNWTRETGSLIGSVFVYVDHTVPVEAVRQELSAIAAASALWDRRVVSLQVSDVRETVIELRALVSARNAPQTWDLRCEVREKLVGFLQQHYPHALPQRRLSIDDAGAARDGREPASPFAAPPAPARPVQSTERR